MRVPLIARWPARIPAGRVVHEAASSLDLFPTIVALAGATLPAKQYDGKDISRLLTGQAERIGGQGVDGGREIVFFGRYRPRGAALGQVEVPSRRACGREALRSSTWRPIRARSRT